MRCRLLIVLAALLLATCVARGQPVPELVLSPDPQVPGVLTASTQFSHLAPAGFADTVIFTAPVAGRLTVDLAFLPFPFVPADANFFQDLSLDGSFFSICCGQRTTVGPLDLAAGHHVLDVIGVASIPHNVPLPIQPVGAYNVSLALAPIPEPYTWLLVMSGVAAVAFRATRARRG
jgi:hypothetical protein